MSEENMKFYLFESNEIINNNKKYIDNIDKMFEK